MFTYYVRMFLLPNDGAPPFVWCVRIKADTKAEATYKAVATHRQKIGDYTPIQQKTYQHRVVHQLQRKWAVVMASYAFIEERTATRIRVVEEGDLF
jgi:hypothetical protein